MVLFVNEQKVQQCATQDQIAYFGQTPSQLLTVPHVKRMPLADVLHLQVRCQFFHGIGLVLFPDSLTFMT